MSGPSLFGGEGPEPAPAPVVVDQSALFDAGGLVRTCGGCSRTVNRCRCAAVGILEAPALFGE